MAPREGQEYRCTPIFAGYTCQGLWPVYWRTRNPEIRRTLLKAADWFLSKQEDARGSNPGTFPNSYWYGQWAKASDPILGNYAVTSHVANALLQAYRATRRHEYFYAANAAWVGVLNHQTAEGGVPLENDLTNSVWSHVMVESLPDFAATAEAQKLPIVLRSRTGVPGTSFMGKGATYDGQVFTFELKYRHEQAVPVAVFWPTGRPRAVRLEGAPVPIRHDLKRRVISFELPPSPEFRVCRVEVE
jgi:hypothetical protein